MAEPLRPDATRTYLRANWVFVPTIASATLAPTVAEVSGASALDFTNIAFSDGAPVPSATTNRVRENRRFGDAATGEFIGETTHEGGEITYAFAPQAAAAADGKKMWEKIPGGTTGYLVRRMGVDKATAFAAGQFVDVWPVEFGPSRPADSGDGEAAQAAAIATYAVGTPKYNVAVLV